VGPAFAGPTSNKLTRKIATVGQATLVKIVLMAMGSEGEVHFLDFAAQLNAQTN
jgi:hypothetical protein